MAWNKGSSEFLLKSYRHSDNYLFQYKILSLNYSAALYLQEARQSTAYFTSYIYSIITIYYAVYKWGLAHLSNHTMKQRNIIEHTLGIQKMWFDKKVYCSIFCLKSVLSAFYKTYSYGQKKKKKGLNVI